MAIALRSTSTLASGTRTNSTITAPTGHAAGDVIVVATECGGPALIQPTAPAGWELIGRVTFSATDPWFVDLALWAKVRDGAASWTWTHASADTQATAFALTGVDNTTIQDVAASTAFNNAKTGPGSLLTATAPSITTVTAGAWGIIARGSWDGNAITPPTGWTERTDVPVLWTGTREWTTAGATGTVGVPSGNGSILPWGIVYGALRPAGAGGGTTYTPSPADPVGITDSVSAVRSGATTQTPSDAVGVTDSVTITRIYARTVDDPVGVTDTGSQQTLDFAESIGDPVGITDSVAVVQSLARTITDSLGITDSAGTSATSTGSTAPADAVGIADAVAVVQSFARTIADAVGLTDSVTVTTTSAGATNLADPVAVTDQVATAVQAPRGQDDPIGLTDALTVMLGRVVSDAVGVTDSVTVSLTTANGSGTSDGVGIDDQASIVLRATRTATDAVGVTDTVSALLILDPSGFEDITVTVSLEPRRTTATLGERSTTAALAPRRTAATLEDR